MGLLTLVFNSLFSILFLTQYTFSWLLVLRVPILLKGIVHPKRKILSPFTHPHVILNHLKRTSEDFG